MKVLMLTLCCCLATSGLFGQDPSGQPIPEWLTEKWAEQTQNNGTWLADNSKYQSVQEPFDAYGIQWEYGLGKKHLRGRLYALKDGKEVGTIWSFTEFWDPRDAVVRIVQLGSDGTLGQGTLWREADGSTKEQQLFVSPQGPFFETGHHAWMENGAQHTRSYRIADGKWEEHRHYIWQLQASNGK